MAHASWDKEEGEKMTIQRGQKYTHQLLNSKKAKFALVNCVLLELAEEKED